MKIERTTLKRMRRWSDEFRGQEQLREEHVSRARIECANEELSSALEELSGYAITGVGPHPEGGFIVTAEKIG